LLKLIKSCYSTTSITIKINNKYSANFDTSCGVLQGSVLSPILYSIFINDTITSIINLNIKNNLLINNLSLFADDIAIKADPWRSNKHT